MEQIDPFATRYQRSKAIIYTLFTLAGIFYIIFIFYCHIWPQIFSGTNSSCDLNSHKGFCSHEHWITILTLIIPSIISYVILWIRLGQFFFFRTTYIYVEAIREISLCLSGIITGVSMLIASIVFKAPEVIPGFLYATFALWFVWYTFFNTIVLLKHEKQELTGFVSLLNELRQILPEWTRIRKSHVMYIVDYTPFIGSISLAESSIQSNKDLFDDFKSDLISISDRDHVELRIICYDNEGIDTYYKKRGRNTDGTHNIKILLEEFDKKVNVAVWRTNHLSSFHFIIVDRIAYQYSVQYVGEGKNGKNELQGNRTENEAMIDFLIRTFKDLESDIVTPNNVDISNPDLITIKFEEPQSNIIKTTIIWDDTNDKTLTYDSPKKLNEIQIENKDIRTPGFKIQLTKFNGPTSERSKHVEIDKVEFDKRKTLVSSNQNSPN